MKNILLLLVLGLSLGLESCSSIFAPAEPTATDELEPRVEPKRDEDKYPPLEEEELESIEAPIQTEEMEQQPLIK